MDPKLARRIGGKLAVRSLAVMLFIVELIDLFRETEGDFANGIIFFFQERLNIVVFSLLVLLFLVTYLCGRMAGREILVAAKNHLWVALKYSALLLLTILIHMFITFKIYNMIGNIWALLKQSFLWSTIPVLFLWFWIAWRIRIKATEAWPENK